MNQFIKMLVAIILLCLVAQLVFQAVQPVMPYAVSALFLIVAWYGVLRWRRSRNW